MIINFRECSPVKYGRIDASLCGIVTGFESRDWFIVRGLDRRLLLEMEYGLILEADPILRPLEEYWFYLTSLIDQHELSFIKFCETIFSLEKAEGVKELRARGIIDSFVPSFFSYTRFYTGGVQLKFEDEKVAFADVFMPYRKSEIFKPIPYQKIKQILQLAGTDATLQDQEDLVWNPTGHAAVRIGQINMAKEFVRALEPWKELRGRIQTNYDDDEYLCQCAEVLNDQTVSDIERIVGYTIEPVERSH